jgi:hypothetical protein
MLKHFEREARRGEGFAEGNALRWIRVFWQEREDDAQSEEA